MAEKTEKKDRLFREKNLERLENPEKLNDYLRVTSPGVWLVLAAVMAGLFGVGAGLCLLLLHLARLDSFGFSYTAPLSDGEALPWTRLLLRGPKRETEGRRAP